MDDNTQVIEKRVKSTVIRRRKEAPKPVEVKTAPPPVVKVATIPESKVIIDKKVEQAPNPPVEVLELKKQVDSVAIPAPVIEMKVPEAPAAVIVPPKVETPTQHATPVKLVAPASAPKPRSGLRILRTIDLKNIPSLNTRRGGAPSKPAVAAPGTVPEVIDETEEAKKDKNRKGPRRREDGLDVGLEGIGRIGSITQLTRIVHVDRANRVFEPGKTGKKKKIIGKKGLKKTAITMTKASKRIVEMTHAITAGDLARAMDVKTGDVIKKLMVLGVMATTNQPLDKDTATLVAHEFQYEVKDVSFDETRMLSNLDQGVDTELQHRPPVVTVMGHVDHGKTSLLDAIRSANVAAGEAGGITQHIGAYTVKHPKGEITFLDTPGHAAFTAMRARGASVTDVVILVVAADDGVMPQTIESIDHAKAAKVPIVVAINKIDKPDANLERIKRQVMEHGLVPEEWGGDTIFCPVSAKENQGIDELLDSVLVQAEILELAANPQLKARGTVIEGQLDKNRGPIATVLVQDGTLHVGDHLVLGPYAGKIRAMMDDHGRPVDHALPSHAVQIMGIEGVPSASDVFHVVKDDAMAHEIASNRLEAQKAKEHAASKKVTLEDFFKKSATAEAQKLPIILKTDVHGSLEAVSEALKKLSTVKVEVTLIHGAVGGVNESDVLLAEAAGAIIIGFNVRPDTKALGLAKSEGIDIKLYKIIYEMVNDVKLAMQGLLAPTKKEKYLGRAEVRDTFTVSKIGLIAGCSVVDGKLTRNANLRLLRDNVVLYEGKVSSLKRFKEDTREVLQGFECGVGIEGYQDIKKGDLIEAFEIEFIQQSLE